jgi:glycosyltransferase involved in cell wall biosynthesis
MPKISLIIPTFNRPNLLPRAVRSAVAAGSDLEILIVDDGSTDETASVCRSLSDSLPGVRHVRVERNQGVAGARNIGLLESNSDYIAFLDDDDLRLPGSLDHQLALLESDDSAGLVAGSILLSDQDCVPTGKVGKPEAESGNLFWQVIELGLFLLPDSVLVRKECFLEVGLFNQYLAGIDDWDMWTRIAAVRSIIIDQEPVCIYRCATPSSDQGSSAQSQHLYSAVKHQARLFSLPAAQLATLAQRDRVKRMTRRRIADTLSWRAAEELPRGHFSFAWNNFSTALRVSPLWAARPTHVKVLWKGLRNSD